MILTEEDVSRGVSRPFGLRAKRIRILRGGDKFFLLRGDHYAILRIHCFASYIKCSLRVEICF